MDLSTYSGLQEAAADWLERADLSVRIPLFIRLCEAEMNRVLRAEGAEVRSTATVSAEFSALPTDFAEVKAARVQPASSSTWFRLSPASQDMISSLDTLSGQPRLYAVVGGEVRFYPSPDASYVVELTYQATVPALSATNTSNWVLASHPDAYLYGALSHAAPFLRDNEQAGVWSQLYGDAMRQILAERRQPGGKLRTDPTFVGRCAYDITRDV